jgi:hypothetical protein
MTDKRLLRMALICLGVAVVCCLLMGCAPKHSIPIASGLDLATTEMMVRTPGLEEGNPLAPQSTSGRVAVKVAVTTALVWICQELEKGGHHGTAKALQWVATGAFGSAAAWNTYKMTEAE